MGLSRHFFHSLDSALFWGLLGAIAVSAVYVFLSQIIMPRTLPPFEGILGAMIPIIGFLIVGILIFWGEWAKEE